MIIRNKKTGEIKEVSMNELNQYGLGGNIYKSGGEMIKRADGSYSRRGLWDNIRANAGSGKRPTKEMLNQERKIRNQYEDGGEEEVNNLKNINLNLPVYRKPEINPLSFNKFLVNDRNQNLFIGGMNPRYQNENFSVGPYMIGVGNKYFQKFPVDYGVRGNYNVNDKFNINMDVGKNKMNVGMRYNFNNGGDVDMYGMQYQDGGDIPTIEGPSGYMNEDNVWVVDNETIKRQAQKLGAKKVLTEGGSLIIFDDNWNIVAADDNPDAPYKQGGSVTLNTGGENHRIYVKTTNRGEGEKGHIMVNHPTMDKGMWDTIDLTQKSGATTIAQGIAATKKWHRENPYMKEYGGGISMFNNGGSLIKYKNKGEVKNVVPPVIEKNKLIFRNPVKESPCEGIGCAELTSNELAKMNLTPSRTDAWFMGDAVVRDGGKQIWNRQSGNIDYSTLMPGDIVTLDRPGLDHQSEMRNNNPAGYTPERDVEHVGTTVGHDERGVPLIKHGGKHGIHTVIQPIDKLSLYIPGTGVTLNYKPFAIYRTKNAENVPIPDSYYNKQYAEFDKNTPLLLKNKNNTEKQNKFIDALNNNLEKQSRTLGLDAYDTQQLQQIAFGIFGNESKFGTSPIQKPKELVKRFGHFIRADKWVPLVDDETAPSLSEMRIKYDDIYGDGNTKLAKKFDELQVKPKNMKGFFSDSDYNDEANAAVAILAEAYNKIKTDKDEKGNSKYNYDPTKQTVYGDIPITQVIAKMYNSGNSIISNENKLREKITYGKNAIQNAYDEFGAFPSLRKGFNKDIIIKSHAPKPLIEQKNAIPITDNPTSRFMYSAPPSIFANGGGIPERYRNMGFTNVGAKKQSTRPGKKWMVLAKKGDQYKVVHGGYKGMQDFKQHHSEQRKENFWSRMGGRNSSKATDPFSPLYWHKKFGTWEQGGEIPKAQDGVVVNKYKQQVPYIDYFPGAIDYDDYYNKSKKYLSRDVFKGSNLKAQDITNAASKFHSQTGYKYPLELLLSQAQTETLLGANLKSKNNFFNVGNTDKGAIKNYETPESAILDYMNLMYKDYLQSGKKDYKDLLKQKGFVNYQGNRYASNPNYENEVLNQSQFINKFVNTKKKGGQYMAIGGQNVMNPIVKKDNRNWLEYFKN